MVIYLPPNHELNVLLQINIKMKQRILFLIYHF